MRTKRSHEGYLIIDHRYSPGVSEEFVRASGLHAPVVGAGETFEAATVTCSHCQTMVILNPLRARPRNYCSRCDHYICDNPACNLECLPMRKVLDDLREITFQKLGIGE